MTNVPLPVVIALAPNAVAGDGLLSFSFDSPVEVAFAADVALLNDAGEEAAAPAPGDSELPLTRRQPCAPGSSRPASKAAPLVIPLRPSAAAPAASADSAVGSRLLRPVRLEDCPDESSIDYSKVSVDDFGAAILRGMGIEIDDDDSADQETGLPANAGKSGLGLKAEPESDIKEPKAKKQRV